LKLTTWRRVLCILKLTTWWRAFLEDLTVDQLVKKFPGFYGTQRFITMSIRARHRSPSDDR
jgi:hypothetical protein